MSKVPQPESDAEVTADVEKGIKDDYNKTVKEEADKEIEDETSKRTDEFERIHTLGFPTKKEMLGEIAELKKENETLKEEFTKLREFLLRKKAQGKATIPAEEGKSEGEELKDIYGELVEI